MTFKKFVARTTESLRAHFGPAYNINIREVTKNNSITLTGITICPDGADIGATVYLEELYQNYIRGMTFEEIIRLLIHTYEANPPADFMTSDFLTSYDNIRANLSCRLINAERNEEKLKDIPYKRMLDLALIYSVNFSMPAGYSSLVVTNSLVEAWGVSEDQLFRDAAYGLCRNMPPRLFWVDGDMEETVRMDRDNEDVLNDGGDLSRLLVVTNKEGCYGAAQMVNAPLLQQLAEHFGCNYYILPSSVHELLVLREEDHVDAMELRRMVQEVNRTILDPEEYLSDHLYYYDAGEERILLR